MARRKLVAGNWKMNMTPTQAVELVNTLKPLVASDDVDVLFCVPAIDIPAVIEAAKGSNIKVGAENMYFEEKGAYTGEISPDMIVDAGATHVIIGHSERREYFGETDETVNKKIRLQIKSDLKDITADQVKELVIAYEPIWAIGTGKTATSDQAEEVCAAIRACIRELYGDDVADAIIIQYGGSVNAGNAAELFAKPDIDGGLVGGASLKPDFGKIVNYK